MEDSDNETRRRRSSLGWGVVLTSLATMLVSFVSILFRNSTLSTSFTFAFLVVGEFLGVVPILPIARRNWTLVTKTEWIVYVFVATFSACEFPLWSLCATNMRLGDLSAIVASVFLLSPFVTAALRRRCVLVIDVVCVITAGIGSILVTKPSFFPFSSFSSSSLASAAAVSSSPPWWATAGAFAIGLNSTTQPFVFGHFSRVHWSNYMVVRIPCSIVVCVAVFSISGGNDDNQSTTTTSLSITSIVDCVEIGVLATIYRVAVIVASAELESLDVGTAGLVGNFFMAADIPTTALLSWAFFHERLEVSEAVGATFIFVSIAVVTIVDSKKSGADDNEEKKLGEEETLLERNE